MIVYCNRNLKDKDAFSKSDPMCVLYMKPLAQDTFHEVSDHFYVTVNSNISAWMPQPWVK